MIRTVIFFDTTGGTVRVGGVDVRELEMEALWSGIGLVPQRPFLFAGTVASNLRLGREDADDGELWQALEIAQASDFVSQMDGGLEARIAQGDADVGVGRVEVLADENPLGMVDPPMSGDRVGDEDGDTEQDDAAAAEDLRPHDDTGDRGIGRGGEDRDEPECRQRVGRHPQRAGEGDAQGGADHEQRGHLAALEERAERDGGEQQLQQP